MPAMQIQLSRKEAAEINKWMNMPVDKAAKHLDTTESQARAAMEFVVLVCVIANRPKTDKPDHDRIRTKALLRCIKPGVRNHLPEAIRFYPL